jgi:tRNA(fMet)-specific endonuclease VapC
LIVLDTDVIVDFLRGLPAATKLVERLEGEGEELATTALNVAEAWRGASGQERLLDEFLGALIVLPLDAAAARRAGAFLAILDRSGRPLPELDALIAAITLENGARLATWNTRHFARVPGLQLVS